MQRYISNKIQEAHTLLFEIAETQRAIDQYMNPRPNPEYYHVVVVPGQNGIGTDNRYIQDRLEPALSSMSEAMHASPEYLLTMKNSQLYSIVRCGIPTRVSQMDMGQSNCKALLTEAMREIKTNYPVVLYGNSQGTSTILQWLSDETVEESLRKRVRLVVLEAVMASGNSAIWHTVRNWYCAGALRMLAECLALDALVCVGTSWFVFRGYKPGDKQALRCAEGFPRDVPVIMAHARHDSNLSYNDACAMMHLFKCKLQHPHAYLCSRMDNQHINLYNAHMGQSPAPNPRLAQIVRHVLNQEYERLPALFCSGTLQTQAEHPVDGAVTHAECYERVMRFDRKVAVCERVMKIAVPALVVGFLLWLALSLFL